MSGSRERSIFIGNVDEKVSERVLYDICIQAGRVVSLYIPRDKETDKPKGFAFAEYESEEIAQYAVKLFSGLVTLYNRTLRFAISGQDKAAAGTPNQPQNLSNISENSQHSSGLSTSFKFASPSGGYSEGARNEPNVHGSHSSGHNYEHGRRVLGSTLDGITRTRSRRK
ncbi:hypothetical protein SAY86_020766 [Trapa natans]|uniref:RRM domain-containing protein n=1 Tax=Trapa natans TaxID=22666 RepID=A0AAN7M8M0_TRANT|nr:hypothetical protein SAY86_020766 [Trapa natans]